MLKPFLWIFFFHFSTFYDTSYVYFFGVIFLKYHDGIQKIPSK